MRGCGDVFRSLFHVCGCTEAGDPVMSIKSSAAVERETKVASKW